MIPEGVISRQRNVSIGKIEILKGGGWYLIQPIDLSLLRML
jgi:hypothetical protein